MADVEVTPLLTVGDVLPSGFRFEAIPDGISVRTRGQGRVDLFVNHETSKVPFPYVTAGPTAANSENDFDNAQVSHLILNQHSTGVLNGSFAIPSSAGYQRFCSNYLATSKEGFDRDILFTNEEAIDYVFRSRIPGRRPLVTRTKSRSAWWWPSMFKPVNTTRSMAWDGTITRTVFRSQGSMISWCSPVTIRSLAVR